MEGFKEEGNPFGTPKSEFVDTKQSSQGGIR